MNTKPLYKIQSFKPVQAISYKNGSIIYYKKKIKNLGPRKEIIERPPAEYGNKTREEIINSYLK